VSASSLNHAGEAPIARLLRVTMALKGARTRQLRVEAQDEYSQLLAIGRESDFLREYRAALEDRLRTHMDEADTSDDEGAHIGFARHHRALASGLHEAILTLDEMWRSKAANSQPGSGA
jgi:hypothetical protein